MSAPGTATATSARPLRRRTHGGMSYEQHGTGRTVVLLHGWSLSGRLWQGEDARLADDYDVVIPDLPGVGASDGLAGPYTTARHAESVAALIIEADLRGVVLVGFAYGAAVALKAAGLAAHRVSSLVLVGVPGAGQLPDERMVLSMRRDWPSYAQRSARALVRDPRRQHTVDWLSSLFLETRPRVAVEMWQDISTFDPLDWCPGLVQPVLFVHGADDDFSEVSLARSAVAVCRDARLAVAEECGHLVMIDRPDWFHEVLVEHLRSSGVRD